MTLKEHYEKEFNRLEELEEEVEKANNQEDYDYYIDLLGNQQVIVDEIRKQLSY